jgi:6-phosphogluconolactonase
MMRPNPSPHSFPDLTTASDALAADIAERLTAILATRPTVSLALPGGRSPAHFLETLGAADLPWERVTVLPGDERFVAPDDPLSNEGQIRALFAPLRDGCCRFVSLRGTAATPEAAAREAATDPVFAMPLDIIVCGMGEDGHIASLFPGSKALAMPPDVSEPVIATRSPAGQPRLTLSPAIMRKAGYRAVLFSGPEKAAILDRAIAGAAIGQLPVGLLIAAGAEFFIGAA